MKIGITGYKGFIGTHLTNYIKYSTQGNIIIPCEDDFFEVQEKLLDFVANCDVIIHLAAMNRHGDPSVIYDTNVTLVQKLIQALEITKHTPHVLFSSSIQEEKDNLYGKSKKKGRELFEEWSRKSGGKFTALIIPNVFGPFGVPFYNSVISTFSFQLTHNSNPVIEIDASLKLIYINDLVKKIYECLTINFDKSQTLYLDHSKEINVSEILEELNIYKQTYLENNIIPDLRSSFSISLFNTFRSYIEKEHFPVYLTQHIDHRGYLVEIIKANTKGQVFYSITKPGITRGNHFHTRKIERFCVVKGEALITMRRVGTKEIIEYRVSGSKPSFVDMPIFYTHNITNVGTDDLETIFWTNEIYNSDDADTFFEAV